MKDIVYNIIKSVQPKVVPEKFEDFDPSVKFSSYSLSEDDFNKIEIAVNKEIGRRAYFGNYLEDSTPEVLENFIGYAKYINVNLSARITSNVYMIPIAVIGMGIRLPGAINTPAKYWNAILNGRDCISPIPTNRHLHHTLRRDCPSNELKEGEHYIHRGGYYDTGPGAAPVTDFDPTFFNISPYEAKMTEPKFRWVYETVYEAFQDACIDITELKGSRTGVYCTVGQTNDYLALCSEFNNGEVLTSQTVHGSAPSSCAGRIAFNYGFVGPSDTIDTACSSGLNNVNNACKALSAGDTDIAVVSAAHLQFISTQYHILSVAKMASRIGRCATFDESADGYTPGEGCVSLILKRLDDAIMDRDRVYGVISGISTCQSGNRPSISAPAVEPQRQNFIRAMKIANVKPAEIDYVEAHGTGTPLGDSIEAQTLNLTFGGSHTERKPLIVGSVKTNIGHTEEVSGLAGLCKVILSMSHRTIPPHLHLNKLNPRIDLSVIPMTIPQKKCIWKCPRGKKRIGMVSSFGIQGSVVNAVVEEFKQPKNVGKGVDDGYDQSMYQILTISGKNKNAIIQQIEEYISIFEAMSEDDSIADICYTSNIGRQHFALRYAAIGRNSVELIESLTDILNKMNTVTRHIQDEFAFSFTGQGNAKVNMGRFFYDTQPVFRAAMDRCDAVTRRILNVSLVEVLYNKSNQPNGVEEGEKALKRSSVAQPALFAYEYAMSELWISWGIEPTMVIGHSLGEIVAATIAGGIDFELAMEFIVERASCMEKYGIKPGSMVSIFTTQDVVKEAIEEFEFNNVSIAAVNGTTQIVISGDSDEVHEIEEYFTEQDIKAKQLNVTEAFHSALMDPAIEKLNEWINQKSDDQFRQPLKYGLISNVTGELIPAGERLPKSYWGDHARNAVQFVKGVETLLKNNETLLATIEVGPAAVLTNMSTRILREKKVGKNTTPFFMSSATARVEEEKGLFETLARVYSIGGNVKWREFHKREDIFTHVCPILKKTNIPLYPFQRSRYWVGPDNNKENVVFCLNWKNNSIKEETKEKSEPAVVTEWERFEIPTILNLDEFENRSKGITSDSKILISIPLSKQYTTYLASNHVIDNIGTMPALAYIDFIFYALKYAFPSENFKIDEFFITNRPLQINSSSKVALILLKEGEEVTIYSQMDGGKQEQRMSAMVSTVNSVDPEKVNIPFDVKKDYIDKYLGPNCESSPNYGYGKELYQDMDKFILYNGSFRSVQGFYSGEDDQGKFLLSHIKYDNANIDKSILSSGSYQVGILDACIHAVGGQGIIEKKKGIANDNTFLPASFEGISMYGKIPEEVYVLHRIKESNNTAKISQYWVFDKQGKLVFSTQNFQVKKFDKNMAKGRDGYTIYNLNWNEMPIVPVLNDKLYMIVVRDKQGYADAFVKLLKERGTAEGIAVIDMPRGEKESMKTIIDCYRSMKAKRNAPGLLALYNFNSLENNVYNENDTNEQIEAKFKDSYVANLELVQSFMKTSDDYQMKKTVCFITMGSSALNYDKLDLQKYTGVYSSVLVAIVKTLRSEFIEMHASNLDLECGTTPIEAAKYCAEEILGGVNRYDMPFNIAIKDGKRKAAFIESSKMHERYEGHEIVGNILITGGLGGVSIDVIKFLIKTKGDKIDNIFLLGRKPNDSEAVLEKLNILNKYKNENGKANCKTNFVYYSCDISNKESLASVFTDIRKTKGLRINGIFHTAGTNEDANLFNQNFDKFKDILSGKVFGTNNILRLSEEFNDELDYVVLTASLSGLTGKSGQTNYVAVNMVIDALARYERMKGRKNVVSCDLPGWMNAGNSGVLSEADMIMVINPEGGTRLINEIFMKADTFEQPSLPCTPVVKWEQSQEKFVHEYLFQLYRPKNRPRVTDFSTLIENSKMKNEDMKSLVEKEDFADILKSEVKRMLMYDEDDDIDELQPLSELGIDSLLMMEVRQIIRAVTKINVPLSVITAPNVCIKKLITYVKAELENAGNEGGAGSDSTKQKPKVEKKKVSSVVAARKAMRMKRKMNNQMEENEANPINDYGNWFVRMDTNKEVNSTMILFPAAGSSIYMFREWSKYLKHTCLLGVNLPGHLLRLDEEPIKEMSEIIKNVCDEIKRINKEGLLSKDQPVYLLGHSLGALLAFETAVRLQEMAEKNEINVPHIEGLIASGSPSPLFQRPVVIRQNPDGTNVTFASIKEEDLMDELAELGGVKKENLVRGNKEFQKLIPSISADFKMTDVYKRHVEKDNSLDCDLYILGGKDDFVAPKKSRELWNRENVQNKKFLEIEFEGGHWFIQDNAEVIIERLTKEINIS